MADPADPPGPLKAAIVLSLAPSRVDVDLSIAWLPFELEALAAADRLELANIQVAVALDQPERMYDLDRIFRRTETAEHPVTQHGAITREPLYGSELPGAR